MIFSFHSALTCVEGAQKNRLNETVLLSTHKICFGWEIRKLIFNETLFKYLGAYGRVGSVQVFFLIYLSTKFLFLKKKKMRKIVNIFLSIDISMCFGLDKDLSHWDGFLSTHNICFDWEMRKLIYDYTILISPGRVGQSVMCLATDVSLTADPGVASSIPARSHTFSGNWPWNNFYGHSPPFGWIIQEGLLSVTSESMCTKYWLTNCSSLPRKKWS